MRQILTVSGRLLSYIFNPPGNQLIQGHGWPEGAKIRGVKYDPFGDTFDFLVSWEDSYDSYVEATEPWNRINLTWSTRIACDSCGERFSKDPEEVASGSEQPATPA